MATTKDFRELALAEDGAIEASHFGKPDFRIGGKILAGLSEDGAVGNLRARARIIDPYRRGPRVAGKAR